jgi:hypothetical protein
VVAGAAPATTTVRIHAIGLARSPADGQGQTVQEREPVLYVPDRITPHGSLDGTHLPGAFPSIEIREVNRANGRISIRRRRGRHRASRRMVTADRRGRLWEESRCVGFRSAYTPGKKSATKGQNLGKLARSGKMTHPGQPVPFTNFRSVGRWHQCGLSRAVSALTEPPSIPRLPMGLSRECVP